MFNRDVKRSSYCELPSSRPGKNRRRLHLFFQLRSALRGSRRTVTSVKSKRVERVADRDEDVLLAVEEIGLRRVRDVADPRVPQRLALLGIERDEVAAAVAGEEH